MMRRRVGRHDEIVRDAIESHDGYVVKTTGDGFHAAFAHGTRRGGRGVVGAAGTRRREPPVEARAGAGADGRAHRRGASCATATTYGSAVNRAARLMAVGHGGQIVCSQATADLARDALAEGVVLVDLGEHRLRDLSRPERLFQVNAPRPARDVRAVAVAGRVPEQPAGAAQLVRGPGTAMSPRSRRCWARSGW